MNDDVTQGEEALTGSSVRSHVALNCEWTKSEAEGMIRKYLSIYISAKYFMSDYAKYSMSQSNAELFQRSLFASWFFFCTDLLVQVR